MKATWRWFGPNDPVTLRHIAQAEATGIVTALHHIPNGEIWSVEEIEKRKEIISQFEDGSPSGLTWDVVESLPVSEDIKLQSGEWREHIENYKVSMRNLAQCGIEIICYNFMPVLDWTRTDLRYKLPNGAECMRFDFIDFAAFDIHILKRVGAVNDFNDGIVVQAAARFALMDEVSIEHLTNNIIKGLPGAEVGYTLEKLSAHLALYEQISKDKLREHLSVFLNEIIPLAEELGLRMCCHPDDPPFSLLGLPRIVSGVEDYEFLTGVVDSPANGVTFCTGSLGVNPDLDLPTMFAHFADRIHFIHLRNVKREGEGRKVSFHEATHLGGETDMVAMIKGILVEENRRKALGRSDWLIPFRPDHGQAILSDLNGYSQPGYPAVGRLKGLAELRGIELSLKS